MDTANGQPENAQGGGSVISFRQERPEDEPLLFELYAASRAGEMAQTGWDAPAQDAFLRMQFQAMRQGYRTSFPEAELAIILIDGRASGRAVVNRTPQEIRVVDVALLPEAQNQGVGTRLLRQWMSEAARAQKPLRLSVLAQSRARRLYGRIGFRTIGQEGPYEQLEWL